MLAEAGARIADVETGDAPRAMRPLAADSPPPAAKQPRRSIAKPDPLKQPIAHRSPQAQPPAEAPVESSRSEPDTSANGRAARLCLDEAVGENALIARPDASTAPFGIDQVLWAEDWQPDPSPAPADGVDAKSRPWRHGLRG
jgi:hypothetical protein